MKMLDLKNLRPSVWVCLLPASVSELKLCGKMGLDLKSRFKFYTEPTFVDQQNKFKLSTELTCRDKVLCPILSETPRVPIRSFSRDLYTHVTSVNSLIKAVLSFSVYAESSINTF